MEYLNDAAVHGGKLSKPWRVLRCNKSFARIGGAALKLVDHLASEMFNWELIHVDCIAS